MKKGLTTRMLLVIGITSVFFTAVSAQTQPKKLPSFRMMQPNGVVFKSEELPVGKPILLIYFSPECDHCNVMMKELLQKTGDLKKASIAMITYLPMDKVTKFVNDYHLAQYQNMYVGSEGTSFFVRNYYKLSSMPFVALYNRKGAFIKSYYKEVPVKDLIRKLKALQ